MISTAQRVFAGLAQSWQLQPELLCGGLPLQRRYLWPYLLYAAALTKTETLYTNVTTHTGGLAQYSNCKDCGAWMLAFSSLLQHNQQPGRPVCVRSTLTNARGKRLDVWSLKCKLPRQFAAAIASLQVWGRSKGARGFPSGLVAAGVCGSAQL